MIENKGRILIVDDDARMRKVIKDYLAARNYTILEVGNGAEALNMVYREGNNIDLILLDIMMPEVDGFEVVEELREIYQMPVIMLTAKNEEHDQIEGLTLGADDYITKPFAPAVLLARIEAALRRAGKTSEQQIRQGQLLINQLKKKVMLKDQELILTKKEYDLLLYLIENKGLPLTRTQILNAVWEFDFDGDERTVDTHIKQLRAKLTSECPYIKTVFKTGYKFEVE